MAIITNAKKLIGPDPEKLVNEVAAKVNEKIEDKAAKGYSNLKIQSFKGWDEFFDKEYVSELQVAVKMQVIKMLEEAGYKLERAFLEAEGCVDVISWDQQEQQPVQSQQTPAENQE